jgi:hypothetical protein
MPKETNKPLSVKQLALQKKRADQKAATAARKAEDKEKARKLKIQEALENMEMAKNAEPVPTDKITPPSTNMTEPKIVSVKLGPFLNSKQLLQLWSFSPSITDCKVFATFDNGISKTLFNYFHDEISFSEDELIGLTESQARDLKRKKDISYLQS